MKIILLILCMLFSACSSTQHFVIGFGWTDFASETDLITDGVRTRIVGLDFMNHKGNWSTGLGYHENVIRITNIDNLISNGYKIKYGKTVE